MKQSISRFLLLTAVLVFGLTTAWAQKSVFSESFTGSKLPDGWSTTNAYWEVDAESALYNGPFQDKADTLVSPLIDLSELDNVPSLKFTYSLAANSDKVNILTVLYRASKDAEWAEWKVFNEATAGQQTVKDALPTGLTSVQLGFALAYKQGGESRLYFVSLENKTEGTEAPTGLKAEDLTTTSVTLYWDACKSPAFVQYNVKVSTKQMTDMTDEADVKDLTDQMFTDDFLELESLKPNTKYWLYVQYDCGHGDVSPWAEFSFQTPCASISAPYNEDFEGELSSCVTIIKEGSDAAVSGEYAYNSQKAFKSNSAKGKYNYLILPEFNGDVKNFQVSFMAAASDGGNTYARTVTIGVCTEPSAGSFTEVKTFDLPKGRTWENIVISLKGYNGLGKYIAFKFGNEGKENRLFIDDIKIENASECPKPMFVEVSDITTESAKLKWVETGDATEWNLVLSTKPLADPEDIEPDAAKGEFAGPISQNPYTATNLQANTTYYFYLQAGCGSSEWTSAVEFKTSRPVTYPYSEHFDRLDPDSYTNDINAVPDGWVMDDRCVNPNKAWDLQYNTHLPYVSTAYNHEESAYVNASLYLRGTSKGDGTLAYYSSIAMLPAMPKAVNKMMVSFWAFSTQGDNSVIIGVATSQTNEKKQGEQLGVNIIAVDTIAITPANAWKKYNVSLEKYKGEGRFITFYCKPATSTPAIYIDDIEIDDIPDCSAVTGLKAEATGTNSISASWNDATSATSWKIKVSTTALSNPATGTGNIVNDEVVNTKSYSKSGLEMGTKYYLYVSPACGDFWEGTEVTTAVGLEVPFYTDFTGETTGANASRGPKNWKLGNTSMATWTTSTYVPYLYTSSWTNKPADEATPYMYFQNSTTASTQYPYAIMPKLLNADVKDLQMSFYAYWNNSDPSTATNYACVKGERYGPLKVGVVENLDDINNTKKFDNVTYVQSVYVKAAKAAQKVYVDLSSYTGSGKYIVLYQDTAKYNYMCIDNLRVARKSDPWPVTDLAISNITKTGAKLTWTENGLATKWEVRVFTSAQDDPAAGEPVWSNNNLTSKQATISGLTNSSRYFAYARSLQASGEGEWGSISFWTECDKVSLPYVQNFNSFEHGSTSLNTLSPCFEVGDKGGSQPSATYTGTTPYTCNYVLTGQRTTGSSATGPGTTYYYVDHTYGNDPNTNIFYLTAGKDKLAYLVLPEIDGDLANLTMQFFGCYSNAFTAAGSSVGAVEICIYNESDGSFTHVENCKLTKAKEWEEFNVNFPSDIHSGRIAFRIDNTEAWRADVGSTYASSSSRATFYMYIDDITVQEIPQCQKILGVEVSKVDSVSATITWPASGAEAWNLKVSTTELADPDAATADIFDENVTSNTKTLSKLEGDTKFYVYVQTSRPEKSCVGEWSVPVEFKTWCKAVPFPYVQDFNDIPTSSRDLGCITQCGPDHDSYVSSGALWVRQITKGNKNYIVLPAMDVDDIRKLQLNVLVKPGGTTTTTKYYYEIGIMTDPTKPSTYVMQHVDSLFGSSNYTDKAYTFKNYPGDEDGNRGKYIAFLPIEYKTTSSDGAGSIYIDDVLIDYVETCATPRELQAPSADVQSSSAKLIWKTDDKTAKHRVRLFTSKDADPDNDEFVAEKIVNDSVVIFDGLTDNTIYYAFVRKECSESETSMWSRVACSFRTECAPVKSIPYEEGFESGTVNTAPDCWTSLLRSGSNSAKAQITTYSAGVFSGAQAMSVNKYCAQQGSSSFTLGQASAVSPKLDIESPKDLLIYFDVCSGSTVHNRISLLIEAVSDNTNEAAAVEITTLEDITTTWKKAYIVVKDYYQSEQPYQYIRFTPQSNGTGSNQGGTVYIDNIVFTKDLNTVLPVAGLEAKKVSTESVTFAFVESTPGINAWQVAYVAAGGDIADATIMNVTETTVTINGLTANTSYDIYVRSESTEWVGPLTMSTIQTPEALPYETGFEEDADQWTLYNVQTVQGNFYPNFFIMGNAAKCDGTGDKALFITNDSTNYMSYGTKVNMNPEDYPWMSSVVATSSTWATRNISIPHSGTFTFSFKIKQPGNAIYDNDAAYVQLIPAGATYKGAAATLINGLGRNGNSTSDAVANNCYTLMGKTRGENDWTWKTRVVDIAEPGIYTVAIYWTNSSAVDADPMAIPLAVDSVKIEEYFCTVPSDVQYVERKADEVTLKWSAGQCKNFEYILSRYAGLGNPALIDAEDKVTYGTLSGDPQITISNLQPSTKYSFYVRTICADGYTDWVEFKFVTPCSLESLPYTEIFAETPECWILTGAVTATGSAGTSESYEQWSYLRISPTNYAILPEFDVPLNKIMVNIGLFNTSSTEGSIQLGVMDNTYDNSTFTTIETFNAVQRPGTTGTYNDWHLEEFSKMLNLYQGTGKVLALRNISAGIVGVKYITLSELPDCVQPQNPEIIYGTVTENSAKLSWTAGLETAWDIKINDQIIENVTENPYIFTGLEQGTYYTVAVRAICDDEHKSDWSTAITFQTTCGVNPLPMFEDFSGLEYKKSASLRCWDLMVCDKPIEQIFTQEATLIKKPTRMSFSYGWTANWLNALGETAQLSSWDTYPDSYGAAYQEYKYRWFISPQYTIDGDAILSFDARKCNNVGEDAGKEVGRFFVAISTDNGETWKEEDAFYLSEKLGKDYAKQSLSLEKYKGQNVRVAFYHEGKSTGLGVNSTYILIDNVRMNCTDTYPFADNACQGVDYEGYGFSIKATELPVAGESKEYTRFAAAEGNGCDSTVVLTLTTRTAAEVAPIYATICEGEVYEFGGQKLTKPNPEGQPYYLTGETVYGCDSTIFLYLTVLESDTTDHVVSILNTDLPYVVDEYYTVPEDAAVGSFVEVIKIGGDEAGCQFNRYIVTISQCQQEVSFADQICEDQTLYEGYGFEIAKEEMPAAGTNKQYFRTSPDETGCDSIITFTLTVQKADTTDIVMTILQADLPYVVDEYYTVPADAEGEVVEVIKILNECAFNRYVITIETPEGLADIMNDAVDHIEIYDAVGRQVLVVSKGDDIQQITLPTGVYLVLKVMRNNAPASVGKMVVR